MSTTTGSPRPGRTAAVAVLVGLGAALLAASAAPWLVVPVSTAIAEASVSVPGSRAVPAAPAGALVLLAGGLAVAIAGRVARVVASVVVGVVGLLASVATARFVADPTPAALASSAEATGVRELAGTPTTTAWPVVALVLCLLAVVAGAVVARASWRWPAGGSGRRYERTGSDDGAAPVPPSDPRTRAMDDWDALSRGEDPT